MVSNWETQVAGNAAMLPFVRRLISATSENSQQAKCASRLNYGMAFCWLARCREIRHVIGSDSRCGTQRAIRAQLKS